jgi:hypothetical protein
VRRASCSSTVHGFLFPLPQNQTPRAPRVATTHDDEGEAADRSRSSLQPCRRRGGGRFSRSSSSATAGQSAHCPPHHPLGSARQRVPSFFCSLWLLCGCGRCVGSVRVLLIRCWFDLLCRVGKTSLMNQYPWLDPPDASRLVPSPCLVFPSANRLSCAIP